MEFSVHALTNIQMPQHGAAPSNIILNQAPIEGGANGFDAAPSGLRLDYASGRATFAFSAMGCLILALRQPVLLKLGEHEILIPKFGAYFVPPMERSRRISAHFTSNGTTNAPSVASIAIAKPINSEAPIYVQAQSRGPWLMMSASEVTWRVLSAQLRRMGATSAQPVAGLWENAAILARWALRTIRQTRAIARSTLEPLALFELAHAFQAALSSFAPWVDRCPGRWQNQKDQVFRRLMRVRQFIDLRCTDHLPIELLASMANYSRAHFMTVFREVFNETPHARLLDRRLSYAQRMLGQHGYSVQETTLAAGFEDRSSFSKLFRRRFGVTALATRQASVQGQASSVPWGRFVLL